MRRFTETDKWRDPWFMGLPINSKVLFLYVTDHCNNAGFWEENPRLACFDIGISDVEYEGALKGLGRSIKGASGWLWIRRFLRHQKNEPLNPNNPAHRQIIRLISEQVGRFDGMPEFQEFIAPYKGLLKGLQSPIGTGKGTGTGTGTSLEESEKPFLERVRALFNKRLSTPLDAAEVHAWKAARSSVEQTTEDEWQLLEWVYQQKGNDVAKYRRHDMATLLNNWNGAIDKARQWKIDGRQEGGYPKGWSQRQITEYEEAQKKYG